jgi:hypothetical protein
VPPSIALLRSVREHGDTKTRPSRRTLALPQHIVDVLRDHRERQVADRTEFADAWQDNDLVFCTHLGGKLDAGNVRRQFKVIARAAWLGDGWTPQELRHYADGWVMRPAAVFVLAGAAALVLSSA